MKKRTGKKILSVILAGTLAAGVFAGCGSDEERVSGGEEETVSESVAGTGASETPSTESTHTIADETADGTVVINIVAGTEVTFAYEKGLFDPYFEGADVDIRLTTMASGPVANEAFAAGEADFCIMGFMPAVTGVANDYGIKIIGVGLYTDYSGTIVSPIDSDIESVEDLKGKRVGTYIGGGWHYITAKYLENVGLTLDDIELLNTTSETSTGIRSGELDAGVMAPETAQVLVDEGSGKIIAEHAGVPQIYTIQAREDFIDQYPELTKAYLRAVKASFDYINNNLDEYVAYYEAETGSSAASIAAAWDLSERTARDFTEEELTVMSDLADWMMEQGFIESGFDINTAYDLSFIKAVEAEEQ